MNMNSRQEPAGPWSNFLVSSKPLLSLQTEDTESKLIKLIHSLSKLKTKYTLLTVELLVKLSKNTTIMDLQRDQLLIIYSIDKVSQETSTALEIVLSNLLESPHIKIVYLYSEESDLPNILRESELNYNDPSLFELRDLTHESSHVSYLDMHLKFVNKIIYCGDFYTSHDVESVLHQLRILSLRSLEKEYTEQVLNIETQVTEEWREILKHFCEYDLVRNDGDNSFNFLHHSVACYFLADVLVRWLRRKELHYMFLPLQELFLNKVLLLPEYRIVRIFLNAVLSKNPLSDNALKYFTETTCALNLIQIRGDRKQTALHVAVEENMSSIVVLFTSCPGSLVSFISARDSSGRTALHLALDTAGRHYSGALFLGSWSPEQKHTILMATFLQCCYQPFRQFSDTEFYCCATDYILLQTLPQDCKLVVKQIKNAMGGLTTSLVNTVSNCSEEEIEHKWKQYTNVQCHYLPLAVNTCGETAVNVAASKGYGRTVQLFMNEDVLMSRDELGMTPLHCAAGKGHSEVIKMLVSEGAPLDSQDILGRTPLAMAANAGHAAAVEMLVEAGANVNIADHRGKIPFTVAEAQGHFKIVNFLLEEESLPSAMSGAAINYIMENEKDETYKGWAPILVAAIQGNIIVVEYLVGLSADFNCTNPEGNTPLLCAALKGHTHIVNFLINNGVDPNYAHVKTGETALMYASQKGHVDVVERLLEKQVDINAKSNTNTTALIFSARNRHYAVMYVLLKNNADRSVKDNEGKSALLYTEDVRIVQHFIDNGFDPNYEDEDKDTALTIASIEGNLNVVMFMVDKGIDPNTPNVKSGFTPLMLAAMSGHSHIIEYLLNKGADINARSSYTGDTALMWAAAMGHYDAVIVLLENNADSSVKNNKGETVVKSAEISHCPDVIEIINRYIYDRTNFRELLTYLSYCSQIKFTLAEPNTQ